MEDLLFILDNPVLPSMLEHDHAHVRKASSMQKGFSYPDVKELDWHTVLLIALRISTQSSLQKLVNYFKNMESIFLSSEKPSWKASFKQWMKMWCVFVSIYNIAAISNVAIAITDVHYECPALTDLSLHLQKWPTLVKFIRIIFPVLIICRSALSNYAPTMSALVCAFAFKMERKIIQNQNEKIARRMRNGLSNEAFSETSAVMRSTTTFLHSVTESLSLMVLILISYWISNIFVCITNILHDKVAGIQILVFLTCVVVIFSSMFTYLVYLAFMVRQEYQNLKHHLLSVVESNSELFESASTAVNFELFGRIHDGLEVKIVVTPLDLFTVDTSLILTVLGAVITYSVMIFQC
ncbi:uncharacterized protein TNIN_81071 [Trichonephila inaurata madagascariensis]|uniref:Uncharacterized protein n=1 Tax=Trichonephila inaurata madagascariensis TaxID=2747483 RepID=A0A8X7BYK8_9ARAC|nr:uncharacterized protein TNIN_81071 [Trichonephila inaurata madagascariensis]